MFLKTKLNLSYTRFCIIFMILLFCILNSINYSKTAHWFTSADGVDYIGLVSVYIFCFCISLGSFALLAHRYTIKLMSVIFIVLSVMATYFTSQYNVAIERVMIENTLHTDAVEITSLLSVSMLPYALFLLLIPLALLWRINIIFKPFWPHLLTTASIILISFGVAIGTVYIQHERLIRAVNLSNQYVLTTLVPGNLIVGIASTIQHAVQDRFISPKPPITITGNVTKEEDLIVVLAIGESSRQKNLSVYGYQGNNTTPKLSLYEDLYTLNGQAKYGSTLYALPQILVKNDVALVDITSTLGIPSSCYVNFTLYDNCNAIGETQASNCRYGKCYDEDVLPLLEQALDEYRSGQRLIVLHFGGGSHGPVYQTRYPKEFEVFDPQCRDANILKNCTKEELYNSYDNSILYLDYVLDSTINLLEANNKPYVLIFTSDHGHSLLEEGRLFHGMPPGLRLPPEQEEIPLLIKSSNPISIEPKAAYTQQDIFDTVLKLLSVDTPLIDTQNAFITLN